MNFIKNRLTKDVFNLCISFLTKDEIIFSNGKWNKYDKINVHYIAARNGWIELLKWTIEEGICNRDYIFYKYVITNGHLDMLKWIYYNGYSLDMNMEVLCTYAITCGHLEILKWLRRLCSKQWPRGICYNAHRNNDINILKWMHKNGYVCDRYLCKT